MHARASAVVRLTHRGHRVRLLAMDYGPDLGLQRGASSPISSRPSALGAIRSRAARAALSRRGRDAATVARLPHALPNSPLLRPAARQYHPDVNKAPDAQEKFKKISHAYEVLSDPGAAKQRYDMFGEEGMRGGPGGGRGGQAIEVNIE